MALARVQATPKGRSNTGSLTVTFASPPTVGNAVVVATLSQPGGTSVSARVPTTSCTDNYGNIYYRAATSPNVSGSAPITHWLCPKVAATGTSFAVTVVAVYSTHPLVGNAIEVSGVGDGLMVEAFVAATGSSTAPASGALPALAADDVLLVGTQAAAVAQSSITVASVSPVWTEEFEELATTFVPGEGDSRILSSGAAGTTPSISWTNTASGAWAVLLVAYRASTATTGLARVQASAKISVGPAASFSIPFTTAPTVGNGIIILLSVWGNATQYGFTRCPIAVTDNQGHTFRLAAYIEGTTDNRHGTAIFFCPKLTVVAGAYSVTCTSPNSHNIGAAGCGVEVSGVNAGLSVAAVKTAVSGTGSTTPATGASVAVGVAEVLNAAVVSSSNAQSSITVESVSPSWTQDFEELPWTNATGEGDTRVRTGQTGLTQSCGWTWSSSLQYTASLVSFNATLPPAAAPAAVARADAFIWMPV